ncbi:hypothetical protein CDHC01_0118 [Corynebacterium diphtheriae HC01]|uniref:hypothetical protein n=1 Tax=Corynebacterium diphtheriae TaxID=1717 RepID=UPI000245BD26|nr:hypothetical protein [Corynebacterium diphtheriae]AEX43185.1 hypothetical protein CD241_0118 [Corynebacterium diphtheriae 241]AEX73371.1 hypothetical protein CDHC01_0118 [Corynebacterium diphtheriae HC01]MBG9227130.1 hypothetical protein [Corynebacterium diphtheriae bv. gravis]MBG9245474.1 hypothetical protein [Corynebacterium diphtheriae bv. mitis]MBG9250104.1 hypothetical protein [Corynebacterium diphtheriae bv. mitis]
MALSVVECIDFVSDVGGHWWALVGAPPPLTPEKDGTSHQICSNGRFGSDLV